MVKRLLIVLSEDDYRFVREVKDRLNVTWEEFIILAARVMKGLPKEEIEKLKKTLE